MATEQHEKNAGIAASAAVDFDDYSTWLAGGAGLDEEQEPEVIAVAALEEELFQLLAEIAAAGHNSPAGQKHEPRKAHALNINPQRLQALVTRLGDLTGEDPDDDGGGNPDGRGGAPTLRPRPRPRPRRKRHSLNLS